MRPERFRLFIDERAEGSLMPTKLVYIHNITILNYCQPSPYVILIPPWRGKNPVILRNVI